MLYRHAQLQVFSRLYGGFVGSILATDFLFIIAFLKILHFFFGGECAVTNYVILFVGNLVIIALFN